MSLLRHLSRSQRYICRQCVRRQHTITRIERAEVQWAAENPDEAGRAREWEDQARKIRSGAQQSMLSLLEERGFVKDVAGGRKALDWLLTEKRIGIYVGVDPTAPSLHVGHLLPLMALYWLYLHGYYTVSLLGGGTVQIGDPSGRTTARSRQGESLQSLNVESIQGQLEQLWTHVKCLGIKHHFPQLTSRKQRILNNRSWLEKLSAVDLMRDLGSGMRLGTMLARDSVKVRMESGEGMAISEFSYPLFQAYDWWSMYQHHDVQLQIGGSDQYGNICAGMDSVSHMKKIQSLNDGLEFEEDTRTATYGLTTPLLTTASGEKFGKSAGNAVWLDREMLSSFDLYQYFMRTADNDVERYLKLFTFLPLKQIQLVMNHQKNHESQRIAQHILAKEIVELAHGAYEAKKAEEAHKEAFAHGTNTFPLGALRNRMNSIKGTDSSALESLSERERKLLAHKLAYAASTSAKPASTATQDQAKNNSHEAVKSQLTSHDVITLPLPLLQAGSFPRILQAAGLASTKSEAHRLIAQKGAYVVVPNSGEPETATSLRWATIEASATTDPNHYLIDFDTLVLRSGKAKIQICHVVAEEQFEAKGLTCVGWEEFKAKRAQAS